MDLKEVMAILSREILSDFLSFGRYGNRPGPIFRLHPYRSREKKPLAETPMKLESFRFFKPIRRIVEGMFRFDYGL